MLASIYQYLLKIIDDYIDNLQVEIDSTDTKVERLAEDYRRRFEIESAKLRKRQVELNQTLMHLRDKG
jgi:hypothetical protein